MPHILTSKNHLAGCIFALIAIVFFARCSHTFSPEKPVLTGLSSQLDSLPYSEIDIPVKIPLKHFQQLAEKEVDQVYTSPGWPHDYVVDNCSSRYMYRFRRGPLQMRADGNQLTLSFAGYYQLAGSQRICSGSGSNQTPITPWSPPCACGLGDEGERKVQVRFNASLNLRKDFTIDAGIQTLDPVPIDKCTVCFWSQDITQTVMKQLKGQMEESRKAMLDSIRHMNLRPLFQQYWDYLNTPYPVYGQGYLQINPERIRISRLITYKDTIFLTVGITSRPVVVQERPEAKRTVLPEISDFMPRSGFNLYVDARLNYDSLTNLMTQQLKGKRIDLEKGGKYIVLQHCALWGGDKEKIILKVDFTGSSTGTFYLTGKPAYNPGSKTLLLDKLEFDIRSKDLMLNSVSWLFNRKILTTLQNYSRFNLSIYERELLAKINTQVQREPYKGIQMYGGVTEISLEKVYTFKDMLVVRFHSTGSIALKVNGISGL